MSNELILVIAVFAGMILVCGIARGAELIYKRHKKTEEYISRLEWENQRLKRTVQFYRNRDEAKCLHRDTKKTGGKET